MREQVVSETPLAASVVWGTIEPEARRGQPARRTCIGAGSFRVQEPARNRSRNGLGECLRHVRSDSTIPRS